MIICTREAAATAIAIVSNFGVDGPSAEEIVASQSEPGGAGTLYLVILFAADQGYHNEALAAIGSLEKQPGLEGYAASARGFILARKHDFEAAEACLTGALECFGSASGELDAILSHFLAVALFHGGKPEGARRHLIRALSAIPTDHFLRGRILDSLGMYYAHRHDFHVAREFFKRAMGVKQQFQDRQGLALTHGQLGRLYLDWGQRDEALKHFIDDKDLCAQTGDKRGEAQMYNLIGQVYLTKREWQRAADWLSEGARRCDEGEWSILAGFARKDLALALLSLARTDLAKVALAEAERLFTDTGFQEGLAHCWRVQARVFQQEDRFSEAEAALRKSIRWFEKNSEPAQAARSQMELALVMHQRGVPATIVGTELKRAVDWAEQARRDLLVQEIEAQWKIIDPVAHQTHLYRRVRGRSVDQDTSSLIAASPLPGTVLFLDVQGSTEFARDLDPGVLMVTINQLMSSFESALLKHGAMVTTYMGDGFMALVLGVDHARRGVAAAVDLVDAVEEFNEPRKLLDLKPLNIRIGLSSGEICVGNVGTYEKMDYTGIGTTVNMAARIQSEGEVGLPCISSATYQLVRNDFAFRADAPRIVYLKGLGHVEVWDVTGAKTMP